MNRDNFIYQLARCEVGCSLFFRRAAIRASEAGDESLAAILHETADSEYDHARAWYEQLRHLRKFPPPKEEFLREAYDGIGAHRPEVIKNLEMRSPKRPDAPELSRRYRACQFFFNGRSACELDNADLLAVIVVAEVLVSVFYFVIAPIAPRTALNLAIEEALHSGEYRVLIVQRYGWRSIGLIAGWAIRAIAAILILGFELSALKQSGYERPSQPENLTR
ncbi:MAG: hypothetical protein KME06_09400 [Kastovskya adunca ATA6-11-RM4]|jgi:hypothetical protein|nr:hypothetical protein [Kastovskya adunca ATA6-11-RM4]